uniref:Uncharacterized protein n=1 Tax=Ditylenchus dipsaci TaxID=166011 RepID=A0A915EB93_9BILA
MRPDSYCQKTPTPSKPDFSPLLHSDAFGLTLSLFLLAATLIEHLDEKVSALAQKIKANIHVDKIILYANDPADVLGKCHRAQSISVAHFMILYEAYLHSFYLTALNKMLNGFSRIEFSGKLHPELALCLLFSTNREQDGFADCWNPTALAAEKRAAEKINDARKRKALRLKQAKQEAQLRLRISTEREKYFKDYEQQYLGTKEDMSRALRKRPKILLCKCSTMLLLINKKLCSSSSVGLRYPTGASPNLTLQTGLKKEGKLGNEVC